MKNWLVNGALISTFLLTGTSHAQIPDFKGLYAGVQAEYNWQNIDGSSRRFLSNGGPLFFPRGFARINADQDLASGQVFIGNNYFINNFLLGAELSGGGFENHGTTIATRRQIGDLTVSNYISKVSPRGTVSFSLLPGIEIHNVTLYGRIGGGFSRYNVMQSVVIDNVVSPEVYPVQASKNHWTPELTLGVGIKKNFSNNLAMRLEYKYIQSDRFNVASNTAESTVDPLLLRFVDDNYRVKSNVLGLGIMYEFDHPVANFK